MTERDFVGYGPNPPSGASGPTALESAISVVVNYEEGSEYSPLDGDPHRECARTRSRRRCRSTSADLANESLFEYASRVGVWRIMNILGEYDVKSTFFCCALPQIAHIPHVGPEISAASSFTSTFGHGYRHGSRTSRWTATLEREAIRTRVIGR